MASFVTLRKSANEASAEPLLKLLSHRRMHQRRRSYLPKRPSKTVFRLSFNREVLILVAAIPLLSISLAAQTLSLQELVTPSTVITKDGRPVTFAIHAFIEFNSLAESFPYIESQTQRWKGDPRVPEEKRRHLAGDLLREAVESRIISMVDERPLEILITHTRNELEGALTKIKEPIPPGYADDFLALQEKWKHSLNCWSASPSIPGRVLSNWYPIDEGIELYGVTYDSTEHFWQAMKYHPDVTVSQIFELLDALQKNDWKPWLARLDDDPNAYLSNAYAIEFLRHNLTSGRLAWFRSELGRQGLLLSDHPRTVQQRHERKFRFTAYEEKVLWGDLADLFHLIYLLSALGDPLRSVLSKHQFDAIYLGDRKMGFMSEEFRSLMLEIWKVKYLQMPRFREVIASIPIEIRLTHFLNDGDSPDIPIPVYVGYLNQIRDMARAQK
jgi:hypothetical protein